MITFFTLNTKPTVISSEARNLLTQRTAPFQEISRFARNDEKIYCYIAKLSYCLA